MSVIVIKSEHMDLALIEAVRVHPDLYDKNSSRYNDYAAKERMWKKIAIDLGLEVGACRTRWKNLRDTFVKSRKKSKWKRVGPNRKKVNVWKFARDMEFLLPFIREYDYLFPVEDDSMVDEEFEITTNANADGEDGEEEGSEHVSSEEEEESTVTTRTLRSSTSIGQPSETAGPEVRDETEARPRKILRPNMWTVPQTKMDDVEAFFYSMGQSVKKLPSYLQSRVKMNVCQIVTDAELEHHMSSAVTSNEDCETLDVKPIIEFT